MAKRKKDIQEKENQVFATRLRQIMEETGTTQGALAADLGKTRQTISQYLHGESEPTYETLVKIAAFFHVSTDWLVDRSVGDRKRSPSAVDALGLSERAVEILSTFHCLGDLLDLGQTISFLIEQEDPTQYQLLQFLEDQPSGPHSLNGAAVLSKIGAYLKDPYRERGRICFLDESGSITIENPGESGEDHHFDLAAFSLSDLTGQVLLADISDRLKQLRNSYREYGKGGEK